MHHVHPIRNHAVLLAVGLALCLLWGGWGWQARINQNLDLTEAERLTQILARSAAAQITGSLRSVESLLDEAADRIHPQTWPDPTLSAWFGTRLLGFPEIYNLMVVDAAGHVVGNPVIATGRPPLKGMVSISDRDYFLAMTDPAAPRQKLYFGKPVKSRYSDHWVLPIARPILGESGKFLGAAVVGIDPDSLRDRISPNALGDDGGVALLLSNATFVARVPSHYETLGKSVPDSPLFTIHLKAAPTNQVRMVSLADGLDKVIGYRTLDDYPMVVTAWITIQAVLDNWRQQVFREASALMLGSILVLYMAARFDARLAANRRLHQELLASRDRLEAEVQERTRHLAASNAALEQFAYIASHDLQEPLRTIAGFLQLIQRRYCGQLDKDADEYIAFAVNGAKQMSTMIRELLAFSRAGRTDQPPVRQSLDAIMASVLTSLDARIRETEATVTCSPLPVVMGHASQLQSLFQNLVGNALKYRSPLRPPLISVTADAPTGDASAAMVTITVADNGIGIQPEYWDKIFGIFQRLHNRETYEGTGIGLAICKRIVEAHGGRIWLDSIPDHGSRFHLTLPQAEPEDKC